MTNPRPWLAATLAAAGALGCAAAFAGAPGGTRLQEARTLVDRFADEHRTLMLETMVAEGPAAAIGVCAARAPVIAARLESESGAAVRRVGTRLRNPANAPAPWEAEVLRNFERRLASGAAPDSLEYFAATPGGARYMRAITLQPLCLACHGPRDTLSPELAEQLARHYPLDDATDFSRGDLRGAFVVEWSP